jgi:hypothetical protein
MEAFRISKDHMRKHTFWLWMSLIVVALIVGYQVQKDRSDPIVSAVVAVALVVGAAFYFRRIYKRSADIDSRHSLVLSADALVLHDGPTERRIPYASIEQMKVRKALLGEYWFTLRVSGLGEERYYGYEEVNRLICSLASKLKEGCVSGRLPSA